MAKNGKEARVELRITQEKKDMLTEMVKDLGISVSKFLNDTIDEKLKDYYSTSPNGLTYTMKKLEEEEQDLLNHIEKCNKKAQEKRLEIKSISQQLEQETLYNLENFKSNIHIIKAIENIKDYCTSNGITSLEDLTDEVISAKATANKVDKKTIKRILKNEFKTWNIHKTSIDLDKANNGVVSKAIEITTDGFNEAKKEYGNISNYYKAKSRNILFEAGINHIKDIEEKKATMEKVFIEVNKLKN